MAAQEEQILACRLTDPDTADTGDAGHAAVTRVSSNISIGSFDGGGGGAGGVAGPSPSPGRGKKMSVGSTLSSGSSDQPYLAMMGATRSRKISEGVPPFISLLSRDTEAEAEPSPFTVIQEESWRGPATVYGRTGPGGSKSGHKKVTRQRKEIFPGYEKIVLERSMMPEGQLEEAEEDGSGSSGDGDAEDDPGTPETELPSPPSLDTISTARRSSHVPAVSGPGAAPPASSDLAFSRRSRLRATLSNADCVGHSHKHSAASSSSFADGAAKVGRSHSMRKPFLKLGDGFLKTFRNLKKK